MKRTKIAKALFGAFAVDQAAKFYYRSTYQDLPYYDPYKVIKRVCTNFYTGLRLVALYTPDYKSKGKSYFSFLERLFVMKNLF